PSLHQGLVTVAERPAGQELPVELLEILEARVSRGPRGGLLLLRLSRGRFLGRHLLRSRLGLLLLLGLGLLPLVLARLGGRLGFGLLFLLVLVGIGLCHRLDLAVARRESDRTTPAAAPGRRRRRPPRGGSVESV